MVHSQLNSRLGFINPGLTLTINNQRLTRWNVAKGPFPRPPRCRSARRPPSSAHHASGFAEAWKTLQGWPRLAVSAIKNEENPDFTSKNGQFHGCSQVFEASKGDVSKKCGLMNVDPTRENAEVSNSFKWVHHHGNLANEQWNYIQVHILWEYNVMG